MGSVIEILLHEDVGSVAARRHFVAECSHVARGLSWSSVHCAVSSVRLAERDLLVVTFVRTAARR